MIAVNADRSYKRGKTDHLAGIPENPNDVRVTYAVNGNFTQCFLWFREDGDWYLAKVGVAKRSNRDRPNPDVAKKIAFHRALVDGAGAEVREDSLVFEIVSPEEKERLYEQFFGVPADGPY